MGVVQRQGIKQSIVTYVGVAIGMVNVLLIYPAFLKDTEIGIISYIRETAAMLSLFVFLGSADLIVRFFPQFRSEKNGNNGFLFLLVGILTVGCCLFTVATLLFREQIFRFFGEKEEPLLYLQFAHLILPFTVLIAYGNLFLQFASNFHRIVVPAIFNELLPKIGVPLLVIAYHLGYLPFSAILYGSLVIYGLLLVAQAGYVRHLGQLHLRPNFGFVKRKLAKEMASFSLYGFLGSLGSRFSSEFLNFFMLGTVSTLANTGIYTIAYSIANVVDVPRKAISKIVSPLLAEKFKAEKTAEVAEIYQKSSINQLIAGLWVFLAVWISIDQVFQVMPNGSVFAAGKYAVLLLGLARIVDMMTGVNSEIISFSKLYRFNFYLILLMAVVHISSSLFFIKSHGVLGVGMATLITMSVYNTAKFGVLWWKMGMQPFTKNTLLALGAAFVAFAAVNWLPGLGLPLLDMAIRSGGFSALFLGAVLLLKLSPDLDLVFKQLLVKIGLRKQ